jgi:hypothetical protein
LPFVILELRLPLARVDQPEPDPRVITTDTRPVITPAAQWLQPYKTHQSRRI